MNKAHVKYFVEKAVDALMELHFPRTGSMLTGDYVELDLPEEFRVYAYGVQMELRERAMEMLGVESYDEWDAIEVWSGK
jgi:hypothetical protein